MSKNDNSPRMSRNGHSDILTLFAIAQTERKIVAIVP
jgi:hypothetical protein